MTADALKEIADALSFVAIAILIHAVVSGPSSNYSQIRDVAKAVEKLADAVKGKGGAK